jgi:hypothetical protein
VNLWRNGEEGSHMFWDRFPLPGIFKQCLEIPFGGSAFWFLIVF